MWPPPALVAIGRDVSERRLVDEQQRRADFQTLQFQAALLELARAESGGLDEFLTHVTALAAATLDVARVSVWVYNDTHTEIRCPYPLMTVNVMSARAALSWKCSAIRVISARSGSAARSLQVTLTHRPACLWSFWNESTCPSRQLQPCPGSPRLGEGRPVGAGAHEVTGDARHWKLDEQNFGASLADLTALALETDRDADGPRGTTPRRRPQARPHRPPRCHLEPARDRRTPAAPRRLRHHPRHQPGHRDRAPP